MAWGAMGHETVAYIATNFVASTTKTYFQSLLGDTSTDYLATVSTWADSYRYTTAGKFSAGYHYIDAQDSPPSSCGVDLDRDCEGGCVVSAIANYTTRVLNTKLSTADRQIAAKMIIHFIGDIGQPLHCEELESGGNGIDVTYDGESTNLHAIWDSDIPESVSGGSSQSSAKTWATTLTTAINSGTYKSEAAGWVSNLNIKDAETTALDWASEANAYVCTTVLKGGITAVENKELDGTYTTTAQPVVKEQIAKQGYRLAKWLDAIAAA
ncbi:S1/P1 nuclease [Truncatella angustata]|uniref:S1/P1 nuclease n=1 Tax=Truncatella angustata TaxID=152316 RepID=A0A9P9A1S3_9PEZI|nr:S1/P1 nuclease [Truncatella angustata]KAH6659881.1 S1/P1 nuclease [Truncatella angustata]